MRQSERALHYLKQRNVMPSQDFYQMAAELRGYAWTVSRLNKISDIYAVQVSLMQALKRGWDFKGWQDYLERSDYQEIKALSLAHKKVIFRNAMATAYHQGKWVAFEKSKVSKPFLKYVAIGDHRTRPAHRAMHGMILPLNDARWGSLAPPNGHQCRCTLINLSEKEAKAQGYHEDKKLPTYRHKNGQEITVHADKGWNAPLDIHAHLLQREKQIGLPHSDMPQALMSDKAKPKAWLDGAKLFDLKVVDFSNVTPVANEIERLLVDKLDNKPKYQEAYVGAQYQVYFKTRLDRPEPVLDDRGNNKAGFDYWVTRTGEKLDFMYTMHGYKPFKVQKLNENFANNDKNWENQKQQITDHLAKADIIPIDLRHLNDDNAVVLVNYILMHLTAAQKKQFVLITGSI